MTFAGFNAGTLEETRLTIAWTFSLDSALPLAGVTSTAALDWSSSESTNTLCCGIVRFTVAAETPSMADTVFASSVCNARWKSTRLENSSFVIPPWSMIDQPSVDACGMFFVLRSARVL